ncbi:hypothetical protein LTR10_004664 [Elasticomyces elasticus]|nr:hypothetical protein LTR10_004664 [Elasticomyces elasticus]KAK4976983.1 hypothetical protein LTR42_003029 [Elasticomyces elasticus]
MADALAQLEAEFCPPLDPALLSAILSDYDLDSTDGLVDARNILEQLKESAILEEAAGFDPSGTGAQDETTLAGKRAESCPETSRSRTEETDMTSLSNGLSSLDLDEDVAHRTSNDDLEMLDDETKLSLLQDLFGDRVSLYTLQFTLKKCNGKWQAAMEELLNHVYFEEAENSDDGSKLAKKGIDAFFDGDTAKRGRKTKSRRRFKSLEEGRASSLPVSPVESPAPSANKWRSASEDIDYIASRTRIGISTVSSVYYEKGASIPQTIGALLKLSMEESKHIVTDDAAVASHAQDLGYDFPKVAPEYLATIIRLTHPSTSAAHDLAEALTAKPRNANVNGGAIQIIPRYASPFDSEELPRQVAHGTARSSAGSQFQSVDTSASATQVSAYASARAAAFSQASAAHRRAKSDRLMGGAAAYYGQVGREYSAMKFSASAAAADQLVATQSSNSQLDLHGVDVLNGIRIAQEHVDDWWSRLGESRVNGRVGANDRSSGYSIVVGAGRHSEGGKGKLGPAVTKALKQHGWKVENAGAVLVVRGRA